MESVWPQMWGGNLALLRRPPGLGLGGVGANVGLAEVEEDAVLQGDDRAAGLDGLEGLDGRELAELGDLRPSGVLTVAPLIWSQYRRRCPLDRHPVRVAPVPSPLLMIVTVP